MKHRSNFRFFFQGKYVLLDFSTFYCGWCLKAIPALGEIKRCHNEMLEIITFYVDKNPVGLLGGELIGDFTNTPFAN
ncbi:hypothetical protein LZF95_00510 [Algoriphagus sp. AGSA1]|uniref:TlpA family protein disulfide reductase n=1 Tax=Algoriphagus sp. AGSA1 TaxID=2907213 RepID=UPI001F1E2DCD|nr:hypothetical protein [Algoriphagus sp. AGSA1]MCE7053134.1 hypothetical protein [Algoriphagus sp. AGSA1]